MGDFKFSVNSSVGSVSSVEFPASSTSSTSLFFTTPTSVPDSISSHQQHSAMQDELLIEKSAVKSQQQLSPNSDVNVEQNVKTKEDDNSSGSIGNVQTDNKPNDGQIGPAVTTPLQLGTGFNVSEPSLNVINSTNTSTASLWSSGPMEDGLLHSLNVPAVNGTLPFQNFPPTNPNPLYNTSLGPQIAGLPQSQGQPPQRRAITATHNFPHNLSRHIQQQNHPQNMFMPNKSYTSWSSPQQNTWSPGPQNQANMQGLSPWNRGRSVPNLNPLQTMGNMGNLGNRKPSPTFNHQHSGMVISPIKFRRSTSYPGKGLFPQPPTFEITNMDENREVLLPYPRSFTSIKNVIDNSKRGAALCTPDKHRKRKRPVTGIDSFSKEAIARFIYGKLDKGEHVTVGKVFDHLKQNYETYLYKGSHTSLRRIIKEMGFVWQKGDPFAYVRENDDIRFKRSCFLREYMRNKNSENPKPVVFLDETWIFMNGSPSYTWNKHHKCGDDVQGVLRRPVSEGGRLVIVHAGTKDGFVPGADLIFSTKLKKDQDYHGAMNSENFQKWVETQLIVGLKDIGPCVVVMDNASYHSKLVDHRPTTKWKKDQLVSWLRQNGVSPPENATKDELQRLCQMNQSRLKRYIVDEMLRNEGHTVLRLPPYHSFFNAIELVWSVAKGHYNKTVASRPGHGLPRAEAVWKESLEQVTPEIWKNEVKHTEEKIVEFYDKEVRGVPEVEDLIIHHGSSDSEEEEEEGSTEEEELAVPL